MDTLKDIHDRLAYVKVKTRDEALKLKDKAQEAVLSGKSVVIFFDTGYHSYLASGQDPYQLRKDVENFLKPTPVESPKTKPTKKGTSKNIVTRNASGRFVSKKETAPHDKKSFWDSFK